MKWAHFYNTAVVRNGQFHLQRSHSEIHPFSLLLGLSTKLWDTNKDIWGYMGTRNITELKKMNGKYKVCNWYCQKWLLVNEPCSPKQLLQFFNGILVLFNHVITWICLRNYNVFWCVGVCETGKASLSNLLIFLLLYPDAFHYWTFYLLLNNKMHQMTPRWNFISAS